MTPRSAPGVPRDAKTAGGQNSDLMLRSLFCSPREATLERFWSHFGSILAPFWSDLEVNVRLRWGLFSLLFFLVCFGFLGLLVSLRPVFSQGFSGI